MTALRGWTGAGEETSLAVGVDEEVDVECCREQWASQKKAVSTKSANKCCEGGPGSHPRRRPPPLKKKRTAFLLLAFYFAAVYRIKLVNCNS